VSCIKKGEPSAANTMSKNEHGHGGYQGKKSRRRKQKTTNVLQTAYGVD